MGWIVLGVWVLMFAGIAVMLSTLWSSWQTTVERQPTTTAETPDEMNDPTD